MVAVVITILLGIAAGNCFNEGQSLGGWICVVVIALTWFVHIVWIDDARARVNRMNYWARGGPKE